MKKWMLFFVLGLVAMLNLAGAASQEEKMLKDLSSRDVEKRRTAAESLADYKYEPAVPALAQALKDSDEGVRAMSALALWNIGDASASAKPQLKAALTDINSGGLTRIYSAGALANLDEDTKTLIPAVKEVTTDPEIWVRAYAIEKLLDWDVSIKSLIPQIESVFLSTPMGTPKEKTSFGFFASFLDTDNQDPNSAGKELLAKALSKYPQPPEMLPIWRTALEDPTESVRGYAMDKLLEFNPPSPEVVERVCKYTRDRSDMDRMNAVSALGSMKTIPPNVVAVIIAAMMDKQEMVREYSAKALGKVKPVTKDVVDALIVGLRDKKTDVRDAAAEALEEIGPAGKDAIPVLRDVAAKDKEWTVQASAKRALSAMGEKVDW